MSTLHETIGTKTYNALLAGVSDAELIAVPVQPGNGVIELGTLLYRTTAGLYAPAKAANITDDVQIVVLAEAVSSGSESSGTAEDAQAYRRGTFASGKVKVTDADALTQANIVVLRKQGIFFDAIESTDTFNNAL